MIPAKKARRNNTDGGLCCVQGFLQLGRAGKEKSGGRAIPWKIPLDEGGRDWYTKENNARWENARMKKILFICHGNICRSPMAEFVMKDLVKKAGLASQFQIQSAATSREEIGNPVYPPARRKLSEHGIACEGHAARQLTGRDYARYDLLIGMDSANLREMRRICGGDDGGKMSLLMDHTARPGNVADPWYTGDFEATWQDVLEGCRGLLKELLPEQAGSDGAKE